MDTIIPLLFIGGLVWFWIDSMRARETALKKCTAFCRDLDVQFLDQTVRLARLRLGRNKLGRIQIRRFYTYDFSTDGKDRWYGVAILLGQHLEHIHMEHPDGPIIYEAPFTDY